MQIHHTFTFRTPVTNPHPPVSHHHTPLVTTTLNRPRIQTHHHNTQKLTRTHKPDYFSDPNKPQSSAC
ncbi:hypothetical protein Hanom_Chr01g00087521 [Helianthus anomalus]